MMLISRPFAWYAKAYYSHFYDKRRSYYENFYNVVNVDQLLLDVAPNIPRFLKTAAPIQILNVPFDATPAKVSRLLGSPKFRRTEGDPSFVERSTLFYKRPFFTDKAILQFNFLNDLYLSCTVTFIQQMNSAERLFLKIIREKYWIGQDGGPEEFEGMVDSEGNLLLYEESVYSSLVYINAAAIRQNVLQEIEEKLKHIDLLQWKKEYQIWRDQL
jgi:hypothetical protein